MIIVVLIFIRFPLVFGPLAGASAVTPKFANGNSAG
jgi:hypothetical protein